MGVQEKDSSKRSRKQQIQKAILYSVGAVGFISMAVLAPNALQALKMFGLAPHKRQREAISRSRNKLIELGLLEKNEAGFVKLTERGKARLAMLEMKNFAIQKPKKWDGKWRILIFDIPNARKGLRDKVRQTLISIGFARLQHSVWVYPYDCEDLVTLLKADFKIGKDLLYLIVDSIENDRQIRKMFDLPGSF